MTKSILDGDRGAKIKVGWEGIRKKDDGAKSNGGA